MFGIDWFVDGLNKWVIKRKTVLLICRRSAFSDGIVPLYLLLPHCLYIILLSPHVFSLSSSPKIRFFPPSWLLIILQWNILPLPLPMCHRGSLPVLFLFYCLMGDGSLSQLPVIGPKVWTIQKSVFTLQTNRTVVQFDPGRDHLFWSDQILVLWSRDRGTSEAPFTPAILVQTKLRSPKVWTKQCRCESILKLKLYHNTRIFSCVVLYQSDKCRRVVEDFIDHTIKYFSALSVLTIIPHFLNYKLICDEIHKGNTASTKNGILTYKMARLFL